MSFDTEQRAQKILVELLRSGRVSVNELAQRLDVTPATIRRQLADMEQRGLLRRTHGGAVPVEPMLYEPFRHDLLFQEQEQQRAEEKRRIGLAAAELIQDGDVIAISGGTTATQVARSIRYRRNITIVTNTVNIPMELSNQKDITVIVTGGTLRGSWFSLVGLNAVRAVSEMFVDKAFIGVDGIHAEHGFTSHYPDEAAVNQAMVAHARQKIVVAQHEKIGQIAQTLICPTPAIDLLITDSGANDEAAAAFTSRGVQVQRV